MKIGVVSARLGIPASTIRYYERVGLIEQQRRIAGRRDFDDRALFALEFVRLAQAAGFSIVEMKSLLEAYAEDPSATGTWKALALAKRKVIRTQIDDLQQMDRMLSEILSCSCASLTECVEKGSVRLARS